MSENRDKNSEKRSPHHYETDLQRFSKQFDLIIKQKDQLIETLAKEKEAKVSAPPNQELLSRLNKLEADNLILKGRLEQAEKTPLAPPTEKNLISNDMARLHQENFELRRTLDTLVSKLNEKEKASPSANEKPAAEKAPYSLFEEQNLKLRLADTFMEQKRLSEANLVLLKEIDEAKKNLHQSRAQTLDLSMRADAAQKAERELREIAENRAQELSRAETRAAELQRRLDQLQDELLKSNADHENEIKSVVLEKEKAVDQIRSERDNVIRTAFADRDKALQELRKIEDKSIENLFLKQRLEAAEKREKETIVAFETLQTERSRLKDRLSKLLVDAKEVFFRQSPLEASTDGFLEPKYLAPMLPFCFPERLPGALQIVWRSEFKRRPGISKKESSKFGSAATFKSFPAFRHLSLSMPPTLQINRGILFHLFEECPDRINFKRDKFIMTATIFSIPDMKFNKIEVTSKSFPLLKPAYSPTERIGSHPVNFTIDGYSFELFIAFLISTIGKERELQNKEIQYSLLQRLFTLPKIEKELNEKYLTKIFKERVAFKTLSPLIFKLTNLSRGEFLPGSKQGRLSFMLRSLDAKLSSMMSEFENISPPPSRVREK